MVSFDQEFWTQMAAYIYFMLYFDYLCIFQI